MMEPLELIVSTNQETEREDINQDQTNHSPTGHSSASHVPTLALLSLVVTWRN